MDEASQNATDSKLYIDLFESAVQFFLEYHGKADEKETQAMHGYINLLKSTIKTCRNHGGRWCK